MKKLKYYIFTAILLISYYVQLAQNNVIGADISWACVGQDSFLVKVSFYRDCNGPAFSSSSIYFNCVSGGGLITSLNVSTPNPVEITPVCTKSCTRCQVSGCSFPYGIQKYILQGIVNLSGSGSCCSVRISWSQCCRNAAIGNLINAGSYNFYTDAILNRCQNPCDNSPSFSNTPVVLLCAGQDFTVNHGAMDIDVKATGSLADSLTYEWTAPLESANTAILYTGQYAYDKPISFSGFPNASLNLPQGFHLDPRTGDIQFRPTKAEITVMVIQVNEFRKGIKIGEIRRDLMIIVINCPGNKVPLVTTPNNVRSKSAYPGDTVTFNFSTSDSNTNDSVSINWNNAIPGATWTSTNGQSKNPTATLTWAPTFSQAGSLPYNFTVTAKDNACPLRAQFTQSYQIMVSPVPIIKINPIDKRCVNGSIISLNNFVTVNGKPTTKGVWSSPSAGLIYGDQFNPIAAGVSTAPGWKVIYEYTDSATGRYNKDSGYVTIYALPKPNAGLDDTVCTGAKISLTGYPLSTKANWRGTGVECCNPNWKFNPDATGIINGGIYDVIYHYTDNNSCENEDTAKITVFRTLGIDAGNDMEFCVDGNSITLTGLPAGGVWTGKGVSMNIFYPSLAQAGVHDLKYSFTNVICTSTDTAKYSVWELPVVTAATQSGDTMFCRTEGLIRLNGQPTGAGGIWSGPGISGNYFNTAIGADVTTAYALKFEYTDAHKCKNDTNLIVRVVPEPVVVIDQVADYDPCFKYPPHTSSVLYHHADGVFWWKGAQSDGTIIGNPDSPSIKYNPGINDMLRFYYWLYVKTTHPLNHVCSPAYDSIQIRISAMPVADFSATPLTGSAPLSVQFTDLSTISRGSIIKWEWNFGDSNTSADRNPVHIYTTPAKYDVKHKVVSDAGCENEIKKSKYIANAIDQDSHNPQFLIYPNPAHNMLNIENPLPEGTNLMMTDIFGKTMLEKKIIPGKSTISIQTFKPGLYFIFMDGMIAGKLIIE